jgi:hypothetical protein
MNMPLELTPEDADRLAQIDADDRPTAWRHGSDSTP